MAALLVLDRVSTLGAANAEGDSLTRPWWLRRLGVEKSGWQQHAEFR